MNVNRFEKVYQSDLHSRYKSVNIAHSIIVSPSMFILRHNIFAGESVKHYDFAIIKCKTL